MSEKRKLCSGCYDECYWHGTGGATECWSFASAKIVKRLQIPVDMSPPYDRENTVKTLDCYKKRGYVMVKQEAIALDGFWRRNS